MKRKFALLALILWLPGTPLIAQQHRPDPRREQLAERVLDRFSAESAQRLQLDGAAAERFKGVLREYGKRRHELMREGWLLRRELNEKVQSPSTSEQEFRRLLSRLDGLRARELELVRAEQEALQPVLTARQQAEFAIMRAHFTERVARARGRPHP